jgi:hypothetical protein
MNAIELLREQHRDVEELFIQFEDAEDVDKREVFNQIADKLAAHLAIEEKFFYPTVRERQTEEDVEQAYDEHLEIKELLVDALRSAEELGFEGKVAALKGAVDNHVEEEESELFAEVEKLFTDEALEAIGERLEAESLVLLDRGDARTTIDPEIEPPAPL